MRAYTPTDAEAAVRRAVAGLGTAEDAEILADLFRRASGKKADRDAASRALAFEREANALAAVLADVLHGTGDTKLERPLRDVVEDLPHDARRRVIAYRHRLGQFSWASARDQFGPLPDVPPRDSVMRDSVRTVDVDPVEDDDPGSLRSAVRDAAGEGRMIEGTVVSIRDEP